MRICFSFYNSPHLICSFAFRSFSYLGSTGVRKQIPLLTCHQKVYSSLTLGHVPTSLTCLHLLTEALYHLPSPQHEGWVQYNNGSGERDHIHVTFIQYRYHCSIVLFITVVNLSLCLIYKLNSITGTCVHEKTHYIQLTLEQHEFEPHGSTYMWIFVQSSIINTFFPYNFLNNVYYFILRIQVIVQHTKHVFIVYAVGKVSVNIRLLVVKSQRRQKLCRDQCPSVCAV